MTFPSVLSCLKCQPNSNRSLMDTPKWFLIYINSWDAAIRVSLFHGTLCKYRSWRREVDQKVKRLNCIASSSKISNGKHKKRKKTTKQLFQLNSQPWRMSFRPVFAAETGGIHRGTGMKALHRLRLLCSRVWEAMHGNRIWWTSRQLGLLPWIRCRSPVLPPLFFRTPRRCKGLILPVAVAAVVACWRIPICRWWV